MFEIQKLRKSDSQTLLHIADLEWEAFYPLTCFNLDELKLLVSEGCEFIFIREDSKVIGYLMYFDDKSSLSILNIAVNPTYQRLGVGSKLIAHVISLLKPNHLGATGQLSDEFLEVGSFITKMGFKHLKTEELEGKSLYSFFLQNANYVGSVVTK